jgi:hypothetical protein
MKMRMLVLVVKMATVLERCITEDQRSIVCSLWANGLGTEDIHKEMVSVYDMKAEKAVQS